MRKQSITIFNIRKLLNSFEIKKKSVNQLKNFNLRKNIQFEP
jgi:hypothetical protein